MACAGHQTQCAAVPRTCGTETLEGLQSRRTQGGTTSAAREHVTSKGYLGESGVQAPAPNLEEEGKEERREALREKIKPRPAWA